MKGFKQFLLRGNVVDLAVGVVIGAAFGAVVTALVKDLLTPLIAAIVKQPDFSALTFTVNDSKFLYGDFINGASFLSHHRHRRLFLCDLANQRLGCPNPKRTCASGSHNP